MSRSRLAHLAAAVAVALSSLACGTFFRPPEREMNLVQPLYGYPEGFDQAQREAVWNRMTPAAGPYFRVIDQQFGEGFRDALKACRWNINETRGATFLYRLDSFGSAVESMVYPKSELSDCMQPVVSGYRFPPPPQGDYWVGIFIASCTQSFGRGLCTEYY